MGLFSSIFSSKEKKRIPYLEITPCSHKECPAYGIHALYIKQSAIMPDIRQLVCYSCSRFQRVDVLAEYQQMMVKAKEQGQ